MRQLELVMEAKIFDILAGRLDPRLEASGVVAVVGQLYIIFDNTPHVARLPLPPWPGGPRPELIRQRGWHLQVARQRIVLGAADRTHDGGVGGLRELERRIEKRLPCRVVACASDRSGFGFNPQAIAAQALQQLCRLGDDFRPDAIAWKERDLHLRRATAARRDASLRTSESRLRAAA